MPPQQNWVPGEFPGGKCGRCVSLTTLPPSCAVVMKSVNLNFLEPSGPLQACNGADLPFTCEKCLKWTHPVGRVTRVSAGLSVWAASFRERIYVSFGTGFPHSNLSVVPPSWYLHVDYNHWLRLKIRYKKLYDFKVNQIRCNRLNTQYLTQQIAQSTINI